MGKNIYNAPTLDVITYLTDVILTSGTESVTEENGDTNFGWNEFNN